LNENVGKGKFILERASIDEMYVDVTSHCYDLNCPVWSNGDGLCEISKKESVVVCCSNSSPNDADDDDLTTVAIWRGATVGRGIRKYVYDTLGFTLSAGISINKLL
jgi:nucleotidyltransferase/DNA polymerase involved in DNA repair